MTTQELRELDAWIAEHVMEWKWINGPNVWSVDSTTSRNFHPTILSADAMDVLKKCAEKCTISVNNCAGSKYLHEWGVYSHDDRYDAEAETLELAICLFAKQLFGQTTK